MNHSNRPLQRLTLGLAVGLSVLIAVLAPVSYFLIMQRGLVSTLESQTDLTVSAVNSIILSNPQMWRYEEVRLAELLDRRAHDGVPQFWKLEDSTGELIAKSSAPVQSPVQSYQRKIHDAGVVVGRIQVSRSLRPLLYSTALVSAVSVVLATILFFVFRSVPLRIINSAIKVLGESEKKYRSLYESMKEGMALHRVVYDENGAFSSLTVIDVNPSCATMFGGDISTVIGRDSCELFGENFREFLSELLNVMEHGTPIVFEMKLPGREDYYSVQAFSPDQGLIATLFDDITDRRQSERQIQKMAYFDTLTGLPNRALFFDRLNQSIACAKRENTRLAVLFLDLDRFKSINDTLGHAIGDLLLIEVAQRLANQTRSSDTLARLGGDEFVVVVNNLGTQMNVTNVAQNLINAIQPTCMIKGNELHVTTSIGIALFPDDSSNPESLVKYADMAMYSSKEAGRNAFNFYSPIMKEKTVLRMELEAGLRNALEQEEFFVEFQPIMSAGTHTIVAAEALVRWNNPTRGRIPPNEFISLAEETGLILPLGEWVLRTVCRQMKLWSDAGFPLIRFCVNVSSKQLEQNDFVETVSSVLRETGANAAQLEIELTESCLVANIESNISDVFGMREWGISIAIDDFGTGYSSLSYIKNLPIDHIKIDRSFIKDLTNDFHDQAIVEAIIAMSQKLGIQNIAEGVETVEQLKFLQEQGCGEIQGFYFHRPLSVNDFEVLLRSQQELDGGANCSTAVSDQPGI